MKLPPVTNVVADDLDALAAHSLGPDYVDELARIGFGPGMVTVEINEDAISSPARRGESDVAVIAAVRSRTWNNDCRVGPDLAAPRSDGSARMTAAVLYQAFGDGCADHRCTSDPDVALIIHEVQKDMEWFILGQQRRLPDGRDLGIAAISN